jgi:hypothetical protein
MRLITFTCKKRKNNKIVRIFLQLLNLANIFKIIFQFKINVVVIYDIKCRDL